MGVSTLTLIAFMLITVAAAQEYPPPIGVPDYGWETSTLLDTYVHADDGHFSWELLDVYNYTNVDVYIVNMTSQKWLDETRVSRSIWWHQMGIAIPHDVKNYTTAWLFIDGGSNSNPDEIPGKNSYFNLGAAWFANSTGCVSAYIRQVPNQPIVFYDDPTNRSRSEDWIIAYTWKWVIDAIQNGTPANEVDKEIVLRLPMTKAGNKGMDAVAEISSAFGGEELKIDKFVIAGASKRGWTAWSVAATDRRVIAVTPLVMSLMWFEETLQKHYRGFDWGWSFAFRPYFDEGLTRYLTDKEGGDPIFDLEDMFRYRSRLATVPKLMISATGDEFFLLQDSHSWWQYMGGVKHIMMNPNAQHTLFPHWLRIFQTILSWFQIIVTQGPTALPSLTWTREEFDNSGLVTLNISPEPESIRGLRAETQQNDTIRDFRLVAGYPDPSGHPVFWNDTEVENPEEGVYTYEEDKPEDESRWVAHYIEAEYRTDDLFPGDRECSMWFSTEVNIIPDTYPAEECEDDECIGYLM